MILPETNILLRENGWLEDDPASFWGSRPIFRAFAVSFREAIFSGVPKRAYFSIHYPKRETSSKYPRK